MPSPRHALAALAISAALISGAAACSSDDQQDAKDTATSIRDEAAETADAAGARATAEALRASLKANGTADEEGIRSVDAIEQAAEDLPGDPDITGIDDEDGDGLDDDGKVQVQVDDTYACLSLPESGEDTEVTGERC